MTHGTQVIDFIWLNLLNDTRQIRAITQIAVVQVKVGPFNMRVLVSY